MPNLVSVIFTKNISTSWDTLFQKKGIVVDPENIEAIRGWPTPKNVS